MEDLPPSLSSDDENGPVGADGSDNDDDDDDLQMDGSLEFGGILVS
jgi:hypothetical protein